ncbi:MAG: lysine--tRNA ligase [Nanoarchaeota archaeon]|nr:lysine--tRNA ligase [Nanoarchaeota archaeon]
MEEMFWADQIVKRIVERNPNKKEYAIRAGLASSGIIHVGKFRELATVYLVNRAFEKLGKKVRFICYFDDYDRFRKVPENVPAEWEKYIGMPLSEIPDPWGCHDNYSEHFSKQFMNDVSFLGIKPEYHSETKNYKELKYKEEIKIALNSRKELIEILNKFRKEPLDNNWSPAEIYCERCKKDFTEIVEYNGEYTIKYKCECGYENTFDFSKTGIIKLKWRIEVPMKWRYYDIVFEPWGKDHISPGGSFDTAKEIAKVVFPCIPPEFVAYNQIKLKGQGVKMSSSLGNVLTVKDMLDIYLPEIFMYLYAGTKPNKEFSLPLDDDIIKTYDDFYLAERIYFGLEKASERNKAHWSRVYEMSISPPKQIPVQPNFTHCIELINIYRTPENALKSLNIIEEGDRRRYLQILKCAENWMEKYGQEHMFILLDSPKVKLDDKQKRVIEELVTFLRTEYTKEDLIKAFSDISKDNDISIKEFFKIVYLVLFNREKGPRLAQFIEAAEKEKIISILSKV